MYFPRRSLLSVGELSRGFETGVSRTHSNLRPPSRKSSVGLNGRRSIASNILHYSGDFWRHRGRTWTYRPHNGPGGTYSYSSTYSIPRPQTSSPLRCDAARCICPFCGTEIGCFRHASVTNKRHFRRAVAMSPLTLSGTGQARPPTRLQCQPPPSCGHHDYGKIASSSQHRQWDAIHQHSFPRCQPPGFGPGVVLCVISL